MAFGNKCPPKTNIPSYEYAKNKIRNDLRVSEKIPILSISESVRSIPRSTSPGLPWITSKPGWKKGAILDSFLPSIASYWKRVGSGLPTIPLPDCAAFARSHISSPDVNKVRPVWAYPLHAVAQESRFAVPIIQLLKSQKILQQSAYGMEMMKGGMTWLNSQAMRAKYFDPGCKFMMLDYSSFDSSVPAWLIRDAFKIIEEKFDFASISQDGVVLPADASQERRKFKKMVDYFINTPIRNSDGRRFLKNHGVPSGSMFTNIIDTIVNLLVMYTVCDVCIEAVPIFEIAFGDDGLICLPSTSLADIESFSQCAKILFGMTINIKKSYATSMVRNIHFLGYYNNNGTPVKDPYDLIASMLYPQYLKDDWSYCISRALGCLLASAGASSEVFLCGQAVWHYASRFPEVLDRGLTLIRENPRSRRYLDQMGCGDLPLSHDFFFDINMLIPAWNCSKIQKNIQLTRCPLMY